MRIITDNYDEIRKKKRVYLSLDEEMIFWLKRLSEVNKQNELDLDTVPKIIRTAVYMYLKHKLPHHFKMSEDYFKKHNERTGQIYGGKERW